jgi:hypothetical protein
MIDDLIKAALPNGLFAVMFVWLLWWVLNENSKRENKYQLTIDKLADKFSVLEEIKKDIIEIKVDVGDLSKKG